MQSSEAFSSTSALSLSTFLIGATTWILTTTMSYTVGEMLDQRMVARHKDLKEIVEATKEYFDKKLPLETRSPRCSRLAELNLIKVLDSSRVSH